VIRTVAESEGDHGWWKPQVRAPYVRAWALPSSAAVGLKTEAAK
jgi:hypothetical protein